MTITVAICDDQKLIRDGLSMLVSSDPDLEVVGTAVDATSVIELVLQRRPDVLLLDIKMPGASGVQALENLVEQNMSTAVLMLTTFAIDDYIYRSLKGGAAGFLVKDQGGDEIVAAIKAAGRGEMAIAPKVLRGIVDHHVRARQSSRAADIVGWGQVTDREKEVLGLVARGFSNAEIAAKLHLGNTTVKTHISRLLAKLGLRDRIHLAIFAYETGIVAVGEVRLGRVEG